MTLYSAVQAFTDLKFKVRRKSYKIEQSILLTSSNNQIYEFRIPNLIFVLIFFMILRTNFEASLRFRKN